VDKTILVDNDIQNGKQLVIALDRARFDFNGALWLLTGLGNWHFIVSSPCVDSLGPKECYENIQSIIESIPENQRIPFTRIAVVSPKDFLIQLLRKAVHVEGISEIRFSSNTINGTFIDDALIYRLI
jgi:hypothetical protein